MENGHSVQKVNFFPFKSVTKILSSSIVVTLQGHSNWIIVLIFPMKVPSNVNYWMRSPSHKKRSHVCQHITHTADSIVHHRFLFFQTYTKTFLSHQTLSTVIIGVSYNEFVHATDANERMIQPFWAAVSKLKHRFTIRCKNLNSAVLILRYNDKTSITWNTNTCGYLKLSISTSLIIKAFHKVPCLYVQLLYSVITFICHQNLVIVEECDVDWFVKLSIHVSRTTKFSHKLSCFIKYLDTVTVQISHSNNTLLFTAMPAGHGRISHGKSNSPIKFNSRTFYRNENGLLASFCPFIFTSIL